MATAIVIGVCIPTVVSVCKIPTNPDIAGIGVRIAIYAQNLLCFFPAFWALLDGKVTETELESAETQATTNLILAFAILISSMVQATTLGLTSYHGSIVLSMSWMNNTNAFIYFLLYVQHKAQPAPGSGRDVVEPTFGAWARHIRRSFLPRKNTGQANHTGDTIDARTAIKNLVKRYVLSLGSLHLSLMAALGLWLWSDVRGFGKADNCAAEHALISSSILGSHIPFASGTLRIASLVIYSLFLVPGLNLLLPILVFLGFHYCARGSPPTIIKPGPHPRSPIWGRLSDLRWVLQKFIARWWSVFPPVLGLVFLLAINLVFIIDIELTRKQNAHLQDHEEAAWGFGQILAILLLFMPLRDLAEALLTRRMQKEMNLALESAVNHEEWDKALAYVARGADPNIDMREQTSVIRAAYLSDRLDVVKTLLDAGADPNIELGPKRDTEIIQRENKACLQLLRNYGNHFSDGTSVLEKMIHEKYYAGVKLLLAAPGIDVNARVTDGWTPLSFAAEDYHGDESVVKLFLAAPGVDINAPDTSGRTPLSVAAKNGHEAVVKLLLAVPSIDINAPATHGWTPLSFAASNGHEAIVKLLLAASGIDIHLPATGGRTPFILAVGNGHEAVAKILLAARGIDVNGPDAKGRTPFILATSNGHEAVAKLLLDAPGINVNAPDADGSTPLHIAAKKGHEAFVKLFIAAPGIDVNAPDTDGSTPLHYAAKRGHEAVVKLLLGAHGIEVNAADTSGWTALIWAAFQGKEALVQNLCAVPKIIVDVAGVKRQLENPPGGRDWKHPASKDEQDKCILVLERLVQFKGGGAEDGPEGVGPSGGRRDDP